MFICLSTDQWETIRSGQLGSTSYCNDICQSFTVPTTNRFDILANEEPIVISSDSSSDANQSDPEGSFSDSSHYSLSKLRDYSPRGSSSKSSHHSTGGSPSRYKTEGSPKPSSHRTGGSSSHYQTHGYKPSYYRTRGSPSRYPTQGSPKLSSYKTRPSPRRYQAHGSSSHCPPSGSPSRCPNMDSPFHEPSRRSLSHYPISVRDSPPFENEEVITISSDCSSNEDTYSSKTPGQKNSSNESEEDLPSLNCSYKPANGTCVDTTPYNIDGYCSYTIQYDSRRRMRSSQDGRPWKAWVTSSKKAFAGVRRRACCKGSYHCINKACIYQKQYGTKNTTHFDKNGKCDCCGNKGMYIPCNAVKIWEFPRSCATVTVIHQGFHTCTAVNKHDLDYTKVEQIFQDNPTLKPMQAAKASVINILKSGKPISEAKKVAYSFVDTKKVSNIKNKVKQDLHPTGQNFEAVAHLKARMDSEDPFLIYKVNDRRHNNQPSFVFKTRQQAMIALEMDRHSDGMLNKEYCHTDIKHNRCSGFKTLGTHVYHPVLRRMVTLATMECEDEVTETMSLFWTLLNEVLRKVSNNSGTVFDPFGWMADEAGANWSGLNQVFGPSAISRTVSCQFHYMESVNRHAQKLNSSKSQAEFKMLAKSLLKSETSTGYQRAYKGVQEFIRAKPSKRNFLTTWLEWWHARRFHVFNAFRATDNAPSTNLSESVHAS